MLISYGIWNLFLCMVWGREIRQGDPEGNFGDKVATTKNNSMNLISADSQFPGDWSTGCQQLCGPRT